MVSSFAEIALDDDDDDDISERSSQLHSSVSVQSYASSMADSTRHTSSESKKSKASSHQEYAFADRLTRVVGRWRTCVILMLLVTASLVVTSTYLFLSDNEEKEFQKSFEKSAKSIMDSVEFHATNAVQTFETLADSLTSEALSANATWPFVTSDNFEIKAAHARLNAFAEFVMFMPLVNGKQRQEWEAYSTGGEAAYWLKQSQALGEETSKWLQESDFYRPSDNYYNNKGGQGNEAQTTANGGGRQLLEQKERGRRDLETTFVILDFAAVNETETVEEVADDTTAPIDSTLVTPAPTQDPDFAIAEEIFLKGEDLPGGMDGDVNVVSESWRAFYAPVWQVSPPPKEPSLINYNILADATSGGTFNAIQVSGNKAIVSELLKTSSINFFYQGLMTEDEHWGYHSSSDAGDGTARTPGTFPHSTTIAPIRANFGPDASIVGFVAGITPWDLYLSRLLPEGVNGVYAVLQNSCSQVVTYEINGPTAVFLGEGDLHEKKYDDLKETLSFTGFGLSTEASRRAGQCDYYLDLYASDEYRNDYDDNRPERFTAILAAVFVATALVFLVFAVYVQRRQRKVMNTALRTNAIVASLFPSNVRARMMKDAEEQFDNQNDTARRSDTQNLKRYLNKEKEDAAKTMVDSSNADDEIFTNIFGSKPIADLFPEATLMFADLVGFTAWSSVREPTQVFTLLETVYHSFDQLANRRRVFKVETVGDCYVAVTGVPEPRKDHAVAMCRFAKDCLEKLKPLLKRLEVVLGPDTGDLSMRFGLHSGPVTAGVLRGERARFQLFGDTMNTCSRIETTGRQGSIHISQETADLLKAAGKENWYIPRKDKVNAKGKGELQTYWLVFKHNDSVSTSSGMSMSDIGESSLDDIHESTQTANKAASTVPLPVGIQEAVAPTKLSKKAKRLVDWNVDILARLLRQMVARREADGGKTLSGGKLAPIERDLRRKWDEGTVMDEVKEIIHLPKYDNAAARKKDQMNLASIKLPTVATDQLRTYVATIAGMYRENDSVPFHNFEHASHVTMSVVKLLSRIVAPKSTDVDGDFNKELHDHTYGIASDPLTQFAVVLSGLIHDVDHVGVPNTQLVIENVSICALYKNQSVAEQNSVDISWNLLMQPEYSDLRAIIYSSTEELTRFRQLVVNTVLATDIVDKELKELRNARWDRAFRHQKDQAASEQIDDPDSVYSDPATNRKATIVIEHIIQASDIAHTMQHWHIYRKWNERFFQENMLAFQRGRAEKDPSIYWYKGEIGFFDFYIIPLAKKLKESCVFGVSSDEYLQYAVQNREEWVSKGEAVVADMVANYSNNPLLVKYSMEEVAQSPPRANPRQGESVHDETDDEGGK